MKVSKVKFEKYPFFESLNRYVRTDRLADRHDEGNVCLLWVSERHKIASLLHTEPTDRPLHYQPFMLLVEIVAILLFELYLSFENAFYESWNAEYIG